jgi:misacylated tRNA(Ala) deacylase
VEVQSSVQRLSESYANTRKKEKRLLTEVAKYEGDRIKAVLQQGKHAWCYRATDGLDFTNLVLTEIKETAKERGVVVLATGEVKMTGSIVIVGDKGLVESMAAIVKGTVSAVKGGGKGEKWQGRVTEWKKGEIEALKAAIEGP